MSGPFTSDRWYRVATLQPRLRSHARVVRQHFRGRAWHVLYDPATNRSWRLPIRVWRIVNQLDGTRTLDAIWRDEVATCGDDAPS